MGRVKRESGESEGEEEGKEGEGREGRRMRREGSGRETRRDTVSATTHTTVHVYMYTCVVVT